MHIEEARKIIRKELQLLDEHTLWEYADWMAHHIPEWLVQKILKQFGITELISKEGDKNGS